MSDADDALAIANLKARYCAASDQSAGDPEIAKAAMAGLFAEAFDADYGMAQFASSEALVEFMCKAIGGGSEWMIHMLHSPRIEIDGDRATGEWTVLVHSKRHDTGDMMEVRGRYADRFVREQGEWRIARIEFARQE